MALGVAAVVVALLLFGGGIQYKVTAEFQNASQLVKGSQVVVAGVPAGSVSDIALGDHGQALVTFTVDSDPTPRCAGNHRDDPLLLALGDRQPPGPARPCRPPSEAGPEIPDGGTLPESETTSEVDLDQLFNTLNAKHDQKLQARDPGL